MELLASLTIAQLNSLQYSFVLVIMSVIWASDSSMDSIYLNSSFLIVFCLYWSLICLKSCSLITFQIIILKNHVVELSIIIMVCSCLIARNLLPGLKTCIEVSSYMCNDGAATHHGSSGISCFFPGDNGKALMDRMVCDLLFLLPLFTVKASLLA